MRTYANGLRTVVLLGILWGVLVLIGGLIANAAGNSMFIWLFALIGLATTIYSYWNSAKIALRSMQAYPVTEAQAPGLYAMVRDLSERAGQPMPGLYISPSSQPNAFATGRNPANAAVCCTEGILRLLDERELRGVLGHELSHVHNRDILTSSVAAAVAGLISSAANFLLFFGGRDSDGNRLNPLASIAIALLAPMAATLIQLAVSRTREYDADQDGAALTEDPLALASALRKIEAGASARPLAATPQTENVSHLMIANPLRSGGVARLFATHPPMDERVRRLESMAGY